ncbi:photosystem P840 reaction-center cytochrome c-551 [Thermodesulforhabdus norvegica]|uniref:Quinohemoprotein amine dehydrogenase A, alpha subunit, haem binding n=1 Tax=Thermodesulforhabdus norvegica TaxID=39841 RepID=A0A1I4TP53_9BACT|nr:photosystem P840 reaction-center cytochrome c-551 [Thermodesulforhabdus norvegica]SFM78347.1 Quinohemoprotein amine dehydrogenase A, alpha subunit, haem binding [Thermodesulforhabdus norvegica]
MKKGSVLLIFFACVATISILPYQGHTRMDDGKALFETKCSVCHGLDRPKSLLKSREEWVETVTRMKAKPGASITDEEAEAIVDYLTTHYGKQ